MRVKLILEYCGTKFSGYQVQPNGRTVQGELEKVLNLFFNETIKTYASGRTDAGVHSLGQTVHFDTEKSVSANRLLHFLNENLPSDIMVKSVEEVGCDFDARFSVKEKTYVYKFYLSRFERPIYENLALRVNDNVKIEPMQEACKYLIGTHDFTSFVARKSGKTDFVRTIYSASINKNGDYYEFTISGNGFLYNMVRIIMGTLIEIGSGKLNPVDMKAIIENKNRALAGRTVKPYGLYMKEVKY